MPAINFPDSPSNGALYSAGGKNWYYNGTAWILQGVIPVIPDGSIVHSQLASDAVTTAKIANSAVTVSKIESNPTFVGTVTLPSTTSIGNVSATEIGYIDGVTSAIQTQLNTKSPSADPTFTGNVTLPSTTSIGTVTSTEIGYVDGVTSAIQTQLNAKAPTASPTFTGDVAGPGRFTSTSGGGNVWIGDWATDANYRGVGGAGNFLLLKNPYNNNTYWISDSGSINLRTAGIDRIQINTSGWVTMPYQPAFSAQSSSAATTGGDLAFGAVNLNAGSCYNASNGRFTAPVAGSYWFAFQTLMNNGNTGEFRHALYKNGGGYGGLRFIFYKDAAGWQSVYAYGVIYLSVGDYVTVRYESGSGAIYTDGSYSNFSGYLIG